MGIVDVVVVVEEFVGDDCVLVVNFDNFYLEDVVVRFCEVFVLGILGFMKCVMIV